MNIKINIIIPQLIREAGELSKKYFSNCDSIKISQKNDKSILSDADIAVQTLLEERLDVLYPEIPIIAEECKRDSVILSNARFTWIIDPIDGSYPFVNSMGNWVIAIGLLEYGKPCAGWVYAPMTDKLYSAPYKDDFSYVNNKIMVNPNRCCLEKTDTISFNTRALQYYDLDFDCRVLSTGSNLLHMSLTATGTCIACLSANNKAWDICPAFEIARRAGCIGKYIDGSEIDFKDILSKKDKTMEKDVLICPESMWLELSLGFKPKK